MLNISGTIVLDTPDRQCRKKTCQLPKYECELVGKSLQKSQDTGLCHVSLKCESSSSPCILQISSSNKWKILDVDGTAQPQRFLSVYEFEVKKYEWSANSSTMTKSKTTPQWSSVPREAAGSIAMADDDGSNPKPATDLPCVQPILNMRTRQLLIKIARRILPKNWADRHLETMKNVPS